jgi:hypothetical protein
VALTGHDPARSIAENYREFARLEARGRSPHYEALAEAAADDPVVLRFVGSLPPDKHQPNLLFAAARYLLGAPADITQLRDLAGDGAGLAEVMLSRRTQTNEPARCTAYVPVLAQLPAPLALIEVGASAGLTLLADRYSYDYAGHRITGTDPQAPTLRCTPRGPVPLPARVPQVIWRAGLDINPLDVNNDDDVRWLHCLLWPGEGDREQRLDAAIATARRYPPAVHRGDLLDDLPALAAQAPAEATLVVYHTSVLGYVSPEKRRRFADSVGDLASVWLSNENPGLVPDVPAPPHDGAPSLLVRDGSTPLAFTDSHGTWLHWLS